MFLFTFLMWPLKCLKFHMWLTLNSPSLDGFLLSAITDIFKIFLFLLMVLATQFR